MARKSYFDFAFSKIQKFFIDEAPQVYAVEYLAGIVLDKKIEWNLPDSFKLDKFIANLVNRKILEPVEVFLKKDESNEQISSYYQYISGKINPFSVALNLKNNTYLSHYSAMVIHGLTNQIPKTLYVSKEQSLKKSVRNELLQDTIDNAFSKPQRKPAEYYEYDEYRCILLKGKHANRAGVTRINSVFGQNLPVTNIERTLIDIVVRPDYSGGVTEILKAYERAAENVSVNKMKAIFSKLDFIYPYHQAIGFYLERSGKYKEAQIDLFSKMEKKIDFYLAYGMKEMEYDPKWRIYYPKGF